MAHRLSRQGNIPLKFLISLGDLIDAKGSLSQTGGSLSVRTTEITDRSAMRSQAQVLEGTLKALSGTSVPATLTVTIKDIDYQVKVATDTAVLTSTWTRVSLTNFALGNTIRVYGTVSGNSIDATVVRNTSIK